MYSKNYFNIRLEKLINFSSYIKEYSFQKFEINENLIENLSKSKLVANDSSPTRKKSYSQL